MEEIEERAEQNHHQYVITIQEVTDMLEKIMEIPKLLNLTAGKESCCIFRVPQTLLHINKNYYHPQKLSIGPYHHGDPELNMIEEHKWRFLRELLNRSPDGPRLEGYLEIIAPLETRIRDCYSEHIYRSSSDLIKMMMLDGLFIIELLSKTAGVAPSDPDDPIFKIIWILPYLTKDLLQLENQIPFFVLQTLFEKTKVTWSGGHDQTLAKLIFGFFNNMGGRWMSERFENHEAKHLLDLFRLSFIPPDPPQPANCPVARRKAKNGIPLLQLIPSAEKLDAAGIKFRTKRSDSFLEIGFSDGVLEIPYIEIDDFMTRLFLNSVAFEQCYCHCSKHMTVYTIFMGCLIKNPGDSGFLGERKILENYFGTDKDLSKFFNDLGKDVCFDINNDNYLSKVFEDVNEHYRNGWHVHWAGFKHIYFSTPWSFISALAALILLLLTMVQAFFAVYPYVGGKSTVGGKQ